jgi:lipoprotein NlpD
MRNTNYSLSLILLLYASIISLTACGDFNEAFNPRDSTNFAVKSESKNKVSKPDDKAVAAILSDESSGGDFLNRAAIATKSGTYYFVQQSDTLVRIARKYGYSTDELAQINDLYDAQLVVGRRIFIPAKKFKSLYVTATKTTKEKKIAEIQNQAGMQFIWPIEGGVVTSPFGTRRGRPHDGLDISAHSGTPIHAAADGKVIFAKRFAGYGNLVVVKHRKNYFTAYAHAANILVSAGNKVKQGQQIATVGSTGHSTGPHVHFEIRKKTDPMDPMGILPKKP